jgi:hypothetical protein
MDGLETLGKLVGLLVLGALGVIPVRVVVGMATAPFDVGERAVLIASAAISAVVVGATIFA